MTGRVLDRIQRAALSAPWLALAAAAPAAPALAQSVKVTPLGGIEGEFCPQDRALVFEDPNGTRILQHANEVATSGGKVRPDSKTDSFM